MKQEMKEALEEAFAAPEPTRKKEFLKKAEPPQISMVVFMRAQLPYIRKRVWLISALISLIAVLSAGYVEQDCLWFIASLTPFIALGILTENARSVTNNMVELEMASRFSLKSVTLARLGVIGLLHFGVFCILVSFTCKSTLVSMGKVGVYLFVPYLLTTVLGLKMARRIPAKEVNFFLGGIAVMVSCLNFVMRAILPGLFEEKSFIWWLVLVICLLAGAWKEYKIMIEQTEEMAWN